MREMKDSGIEWVGLIPNNWTTHRIKSNFRIISGSGFAPSMQGQQQGDYPVCKASDIGACNGQVLVSSQNYITKAQSAFFTIVPKGSIAFPKIGEAMKKNNRTLLGVDACLDNNCQGLIPSRMHSRYSLYMLSCIDMAWFDNAGTVPCLNNTKFSNSRFPYPSLREQHRIADFLDAKCAEIDALTADIEKQIETLEQYKRSVITETVTKGLDKNVEMKESKLEWVDGIPLNWEEKPYRVLFSEVTTKNKFGQEKNALKFTYGNIVPKTDFDADTDEYVADTILTYTIVEPGTIMINCLNLNYDFISQRIGLVKDKGIITSAYLAIKPNSQMVCDRFANYQLKAFDGMKVFHNMGTGIRKTLGFDELGKKYFILPPLDEQVKIANSLDAKSEEIQAIVNKKKEELSSLVEYKKSLIYEYVTGKKEVC